MKIIKLGEIAKIDISNVDKKVKEADSPVVLCNFVDVYHNWAITNDLLPNLMKSTANANQISRFSIHKGQVAITKDSETRDDIGVSTYIADNIPNGVLGYHCALITPDENLLTGKYLNVVLHTPYAQKYFELNASGSGQRYTLTVDIIAGFPVPVPDIKTQHIVGDFYSAIDKKLSNNNRINAELESMAKTIYDYWFTQFDFPDENGKPYKSSGGKMVWNEELKREIPEGWEVGTLSDIAKITMGSSPKGESLNENKEGIIFYQGKTDFGDRFPTERVYTTSPIRYAEENDVLLSVRAPVGSINIANEKCCIGRGLASIHSKYQSFVFYLLLANQFQFDKFNQAGTTFGAATKDDVFGLKCIIPNNSIMLAFEKAVQTLDNKIRNNAKENQQLASLRDWLLPMLMNGQVGFES